jgi:Fibronectin type III domain/Protein of unknown function (DUF1565)
VIAAPATATTIKQLSNDKQYSFSIALETKNKKRSDFSAPVTATPKAASTGGSNEPVRITPPTGLVVAAGDGSVTLSWNANPETDLKGYTVLWGTSSTTLDQTKAVDAVTKTAVVEGLTNNTTYFFALEATNTKGESARSSVEVATPVAVPVQPVIESVAIEDNEKGFQVRQGGRFAMIVKGQRLGSLAATLGTLTATVSNNTDTEARLEFSVPHGHPLEFLALSLTTAGGTITKSNTLQVSPIAASKATSFNPDDNNPGTKERPFQTLTQALSVAASGDTIVLGAGTDTGTYQAGEMWVDTGTGSLLSATPNVPDGVTIIGQGSVELQGPGSDSNQAALVFAGSVTIRNITIKGFTHGLVHAVNTRSCAGEIVLESVQVRENGTGLVDVGACSITINKSAFELNNRASRTGAGLSLQNNGNVYVTDTTFKGNDYGIFAGSLRLGDSLKVFSMTRVAVTQSISDGMVLGNISEISLESVNTSENGGSGLTVTNEYVATSFKVRSSTFSSNTSYGLQISGNNLGSWDLGTAQEPGGNKLQDNTSWQIYDNRDADTGVTIQAQGNSIGASGTVVTPGTYTGTIELANVWRIERQGNSITF